MMWHFYEIPYIPDLELVKYQSLGEQGIDGILEYCSNPYNPTFFP